MLITLPSSKLTNRHLSRFHCRYIVGLDQQKIHAIAASSLVPDGNPYQYEEAMSGGYGNVETFNIQKNSAASVACYDPDDRSGKGVHTCPDGTGGSSGKNPTWVGMYPHAQWGYGGKLYALSYVTDNSADGTHSVAGNANYMKNNVVMEITIDFQKFTATVRQATDPFESMQAAGYMTAKSGWAGDGLGCGIGDASVNPFFPVVPTLPEARPNKTGTSCVRTVGDVCGPWAEVDAEFKGKYWNGTGDQCAFLAGKDVTGKNASAALAECTSACKADRTAVATGG